MADFSNLIGAGVQAGTSLIGAAQADKKRKEAEEIMRAALARFQTPNIPNPEDLGPSAAGGMAADPELVAAQRAALAKMGQVERSGGLTLEDEGAINKITNELNTADARRRSALTNAMEARGTGGSGAELAMGLQGAQAEAERAGQLGLGTAAQAQKRYFDSILARAQMAGNMNSQDYNQRLSAANANDLRSQFNAGRHDRVDAGNAQLALNRAQGAMSPTSGLSGQLNSDANTIQQRYAGLGQGAFEAFKSDGAKTKDVNPAGYDVGEANVATPYTEYSSLADLVPKKKKDDEE